MVACETVIPPLRKASTAVVARRPPLAATDAPSNMAEPRPAALRWPRVIGLACVMLVAAPGILGCAPDDGGRRLFEACESTPQCAVGLDCVVLRARPGGSTAGAGFCTFRCHERFPCDPQLACTPVDREGVVVGADDPEARNAFCLRPCEEDRQCASSLSCEPSDFGLICL